MWMHTVKELEHTLLILLKCQMIKLSNDKIPSLSKEIKSLLNINRVVLVTADFDCLSDQTIETNRISLTERTMLVRRTM